MGRYVYPRVRRGQHLVFGGVDSLDGGQVAQEDIEICDQVVNLALVQPGQQRILPGKRQMDNAIMHGLAFRCEREFEISSRSLLALDQLLALQSGCSTTVARLVPSHQLAHLRACPGLIHGEIRQDAPLEDVYPELSPIDLGGAPGQLVRKPKQQAGYIPLEMEMGLLAGVRRGRHALRPRGLLTRGLSLWMTIGRIIRRRQVEAVNKSAVDSRSADRCAEAD
jgi:hypothetical protein